MEVTFGPPVEVDAGARGAGVNNYAVTVFR